MKKVFVVLMILSLSVTYFSCKTTEDKVEPVACFTSSPTDIHVGDAVTFNSSCSENAASFAWEFGDGSTSTDANPTHTYAAAGDLTVKLTVTDAGGLTNSKNMSITVLEAEIPATNIHEGNITANETWAEGVHKVIGDVYVDGATLTIAPGTTILFDQNTSLNIGYGGGAGGATLIANGTVDKPIIFTSSAITKTAGDWNYIGFYSGASATCSMKFCTVEYAGGYTESYGSLYIESAAITIESSIIQHSKYSGIVLYDEGSFKSFVSDTVRDCANYPIEIYGNYAHTIGLNNYFVTEKGILIINDVYDQTNKTWNKLNCPYIIDGDLYIEKSTGAKLTLAPGVVVQFTLNSGIYVGYGSTTFGALVAEGTETDSIYFTSAAPEGSKTAGDWDFIGFYAGAGTNSILKYCVVEYGGGYTESYGEVYIEGSAVKIDNSSLRNSLTFGVNGYDAGRFASFTNNSVLNNGSYPVKLYATNAHTIGTGNTYDGAGILLVGSTISSTVTWIKQTSPYIVDGDIFVESVSGNTLTIEPGTVVKFTNNSSIYIGYNGAATLIAVGTTDNRITFTTAAPEGNQSAGDWDSIWFYGGTGAGTILDFCTISYGGGYTSNSGNITTDGPIAGRPTISNCDITNSNAYGIYLTGGDAPTLSNNTFADNFSGDTN